MELDRMNLYLCNLPPGLSEEQLMGMVREFGRVVSVKILRDERLDSKGVGAKSPLAVRFARKPNKSLLRYRDRVWTIKLPEPQVPPDCVGGRRRDIVGGKESEPVKSFSPYHKEEAKKKMKRGDKRHRQDLMLRVTRAACRQLWSLQTAWRLWRPGPTRLAFDRRPPRHRVPPRKWFFHPRNIYGGGESPLLSPPIRYHSYTVVYAKNLTAFMAAYAGRPSQWRSEDFAKGCLIGSGRAFGPLLAEASFLDHARYFGSRFLEFVKVALEFTAVINDAVEEDCLFKCPKGMKAMARTEYKPNVNGCGSYGLMVSGESLPVSGMEECCNAHDLCYDTCGSDKDQCDLSFKRCLYKCCDDVNEELSLIQLQACKAAAKVLFTGTTFVGCKAFQDSQNLACTCVHRKEEF
ncbi:unnamed protein product [Darwinula stevensoni]|uniref:RRM domain-containing protein n=1 Tax=Darwinula stevensoni TaxID=69355 RepID=A0A7R9A5K7_9CRUS|nr:unnamed protein product [Darwinula stevensoni]CAG0895743.1 unnamed protein product [Darwinula stevensoni]